MLHSRFAVTLSIETVHTVHLYSHPSMNKLEICPPLASYHPLICRFIATCTNVSASAAEQNTREWQNVSGSLTSARSMIDGFHRFGGLSINCLRKKTTGLKILL
jgi:hypothetical protein